MRSKCTIPGCGRVLKGRGYCMRHWLKWRKYGDPLAGKQRGEYGDLKHFLERAALYEGDDCTLWPYAKNDAGYGHYTDETGIGITTARWVCERANGPAPSPKHDAAHSCRNHACITPRHLSWKTRKENMADQLRDGTRAWGEKQGSSKLTVEKVKAIRRLADTSMTFTEIAEKFGVSLSQVSNIWSRKHWRHVA